MDKQLSKRRPIMDWLKVAALVVELVLLLIHVWLLMAGL